MRDYQYEVLIRHCNLIADVEAFHAMTLGHLQVEKEVIQAAFDLFRGYDARYRDEMSNNMLLTNNYYVQAEGQYLKAIAKINDRLGASERHDHSLESEASRVIRVETAREP